MPIHIKLMSSPPLMSTIITPQAKIVGYEQTLSRSKMLMMLKNAGWQC